MLIHKYLKYSCETAANNVWDERIPKRFFWSLFYHLILTQIIQKRDGNSGEETVLWKTIHNQKAMITAGLKINTTKLRCKRNNKTFSVINFISPQKSLQFNVLTLYMTMAMFDVWNENMNERFKRYSMMVHWTISIEIICIMKCYFDGISSKKREVRIKLTSCNNIAMKTVQDGFDFCFSFCRMHEIVQCTVWQGDGFLLI